MFVCSVPVWADMEAPHAIEINTDVPGYLARIEQNDPEEVKRALLKAEQYYLDNNMSPALPIIAFVLHGPEVEIFFRDNYRRYKPIVDLAARLSALKVVDIKVCRTRLRFLESDAAELFPFVGSVPFGPAEIERLSGEEDFVYF
jgi:intracellular sulfur oxidation DsrE/DsrF family protein